MPREVKGILWAVVGVGFFVSPASAYTLLDFPSNTSVQAGSYKKWVLDQSSPPSLSMSYSIQSDFLGGSASAQTAVLNAISSWDQANTTVSFSAASYQPVVNSLTNWIAGGGAWEGPAGSGIGANIDIMSRPTGFSFTDIWGRTVTLGSTSLAMTVPVSMSNNILSVDIYLNSSFNWSTTGGNYDIETVVLHELGHALGLDHPNQAVSKGAANYDPYTQQPGKIASTADVMYSTYTGLKRSLTDDEVGGMAFLYPGVRGDADRDGLFTFADVQLTIDMYFGFALGPNPEAYRNIDLDRNGLFEFSDVDGVVTMYFFPSQPAPQGYTVAMLEGMGYNTTDLPEPCTALLIVAGAGIWRRRGLRVCK
jgi:hypothetical protein